MFNHLLKPIWKRKFKNGLLSLEILLAFFVVFGLALLAARYFQLFYLPLEYKSVWSVEMQTSGNAGAKLDVAAYDNFKRSLGALPEVEQVGFALYSPYSWSTWTSTYHLPDAAKSVNANQFELDDDAAKALNMGYLEGRGFSAIDEGAAKTAILVNKIFARKMFGSQSAIGKIVQDKKPGAAGANSYIVVGVVEDFRNRGEFMTPQPYLIKRFSPISNKNTLGVILLKVKPNTTRIFEAKLTQQLKLIRSDWGYRVAPLTDLRKSIFVTVTIPLVILAVIAAFLLLMVGFGLFGVLWQNTTQRIPEIGLRRAIGANTADIYKQIIVEQLLLCSLAIAVGLVLLVQIPITGVFGESVNWTVFGIATAVSIFVIFTMSVLCSLYPAWRASRLSPTQALRYE
jgi:putative ABC transport system permease protein